MKPPNNLSDEYKKQLIKYLLRCITSELSKIILFSIVFSRFGVFKEFVFALALLIFLRMNGGGLHFKNYASCFIMSFFVLALSMYLGINTHFPNWLTTVLLSLCAFLGYTYAPVVSKNRPPAREELIKKSKQRTLIILLGYTILASFLLPNHYINTGVWIIIIHICQLILAKILERRNSICGTN